MGQLYVYTPGSPGCDKRGAGRPGFDLKEAFPRPPSPPRTAVYVCPSSVRSAIVLKGRAAGLEPCTVDADTVC